MNVNIITLLLLFSITSSLSIVLMRMGFEKLGMERSLSHFIKWLFDPLILFSLALGLFSRFIFYAIMQHINTVQTYLASFVSFVVLSILCVTLFDETLNSKQMLGALLILLGVSLL